MPHARDVSVKNISRGLIISLVIVADNITVEKERVQSLHTKDFWSVESKMSVVRRRANTNPRSPRSPWEPRGRQPTARGCMMLPMGQALSREMVPNGCVLLVTERWMSDRGVILATTLDSKPSVASPLELSGVRRCFWIPKREKKRLSAPQERVGA